MSHLTLWIKITGKRKRKLNEPGDRQKTERRNYGLTYFSYRIKCERSESARERRISPNKSDQQQQPFSFSVDYGLTFACGKSAPEIREDTVVSAVILCPAVCVCDVMNKAGMCGSGVYYVMSKPVLVKNEYNIQLQQKCVTRSSNWKEGRGREREIN